MPQPKDRVRISFMPAQANKVDLRALWAGGRYVTQNQMLNQVVAEGLAALKAQGKLRP
jgi:hypothetical protein